jgi:hypothetical protein
MQKSHGTRDPHIIHFDDRHLTANATQTRNIASGRYASAIYDNLAGAPRHPDRVWHRRLEANVTTGIADALDERGEHPSWRYVTFIGK